MNIISTVSKGTQHTAVGPKKVANLASSESLSPPVDSVSLYTNKQHRPTNIAVGFVRGALTGLAGHAAGGAARHTADVGMIIHGTYGMVSGAFEGASAGREVAREHGFNETGGAVTGAWISSGVTGAFGLGTGFVQGIAIASIAPVFGVGPLSYALTGGIVGGALGALAS